MTSSASRALPRPSRRTTLVVGGAALTALLGSSAVWVATAKSVTLTVDGAGRTVSLHGDTVADVLRAEGLAAGPHDLLAPAAGRPISDGDTIALRHGRQLRLVVDGVSRDVWVTADDVDGALQQVGLRVEGAALSASRSRQIGLDGLSLDVRLPKAAAVAADGGRTDVTTTVGTVADLLAQTGVAVRPTDTVDVPVTAAVTDGLVVHVTRHDTSTVGTDVAVPFGTVTTEDPGADAGTTRVVSAGRTGTQREVWKIDTTDGVETGRTLLSVARTADPVAQQVAVGTRPKPVPAPAPAPPRAPAAAAAVPSGGGGGGLNWAALAACESGGNPGAVGGGGLYFGLYQFSPSTWAAVGGSGNPAAASPAEQTARAQALYARTGRSSWPVCGARL